MTCLFAYGTLELPEMVEAVTGRRLGSEPAWLPDHVRCLLRGRPYPGVVPRPGQRVPGRLLHALDAASLSRLDAFEGPEYERRELRVITPRGGRSALAYVLAPSCQHLLSDEPWDRERFARDLMPRYLDALRR